jgi:dipeptidase D
LVRFLKYAVTELDVRLAGINAGGLRNAIPREGTAKVVVPAENVDALKKAVAEYEAIYKAELSSREPNLSFVAKETDMPKSLIDEAVQDGLIDSVNACPNGVIRMSDDMPGLVETSTNLASIKSENGTVSIQCLLRSSVDSAKQYLSERIDSVFSLAGATVVFAGGYPGWKPNMASPILKQMQGIYNDKFGKVPEIKAIHAGLECGLLGAVYPNWDMISFGPTIRSPHSPDEKVHIESVNKFWDFLVETLKNIEEK